MTLERNTPPGFNQTARFLHWLIAGLIVLQFILAKLAEGAEEDGAKFRELVLLANHKSVGISVLVLVLIRLGWRLATTPPPPLPMPNWQRLASIATHRGFYVLLIVLPLSGWLMSSASNIPVSWFNVFQLPNMVAPNEGLERLFATTHETLGKVLFAVALLHILAALKHAFVDHDGALRRIGSPLGIAAFVLALLIGIVALVPKARADEAVAAWQIDYASSSIRFTAEQAGAKFSGEWSQWQAELRFDPDRLDDSSFAVEILVAGVDTQDAERDETLLDAAFFDGPNHPSAYFRARKFVQLDDDRFAANGELEIKGRTTPTRFEFSLASTNGSIVLTGSSRLDRLALEIGTDEWEDTTWIGQYVDVNVNVTATLTAHNE